MKLRLHKRIQKDMNTKTFYLAYCRKSSESEDRQMQSIPDQKRELKDIANQKQLFVHKIYVESKSAKAPGRPIFNEMIKAAKERDDIKGIICWSINRLTRNPIDTGTIQWLLQNGDIDEIVTPSKTYTEVDSDFIMAIEGAQASRFIRDLRESTKRGIDSKLEKGHAPVLAPVGYQNNTYKKKGEKDISAHSTYFTLMRKILEHALTGKYTLNQLVLKSRKLGIKNHQGKHLSKTAMQTYLRNPFYTGRFVYGNKLYQGTHEPMLTDSEFDLLQEILDAKSKIRAKKHEFSFTGLIKCGNCGMAITAEKHTKKYKNGKSQTFIYYHCTRQNKNIKCREPFVNEIDLEKQITKLLSSIKISKSFVKWAIEQLKSMRKKHWNFEDKRLESLKIELSVTRGKLEKLEHNHLTSNAYTVSEYIELKRGLKIDENKTVQLIKDQGSRIHNAIDLSEKTLYFARDVNIRFRMGDLETKKTILNAVGSNLVLKNKKLTVEPRKPFLLIQKAKKSNFPTFEPNTRRNTQILANWGD